jgi:hypothetical protein
MREINHAVKERLSRALTRFEVEIEKTEYVKNVVQKNVGIKASTQHELFSSQFVFEQRFQLFFTETFLLSFAIEE